jgi:hypothetical protein
LIMGKAKTKHQRKKRAPVEKATVNPFRAQHGETQSAGMAVRMVPMIDTLKGKGSITHAEWEALEKYRQLGLTAERSLIKDSCDFSRGGGTGHGEPSLVIQSAKKELSRLDAILGQLAGITRAVCLDDMSLTQWACKQHGSRERVKDGKVVSIEPRNKNVVDFARWELKFAANRMRK